MRSISLFGFNLTLLICVAFTSLISIDGKGIKSGLRKKRIVNGSEAKLKQFPYAVLIEHIPTLDSKCTGALISEQSVLTVSHCLHNGIEKKLSPIEHFYAIFGSVKNNDRENGMSFKEIRLHERFNMTTFSNDIAIMILKDKIKTNDYVKTIALPEKGMRFEGGDVIAVGWGGRTIKHESFWKRLHYMKAKISKSHERCSSRIPEFDRYTQVCVEQENDICVFIGDAGGPLVKKGPERDVSLGVASYADYPEVCDGSPVVFTSTIAHHDWIKKNAVGKVTFVNSI